MYLLLFKDEQEPEGEDLVDSEEYDEDEDEERRRKKRKKDARYGGFIIDEAEVMYNNFPLYYEKCIIIIDMYVCMGPQ